MGSVLREGLIRRMAVNTFPNAKIHMVDSNPHIKMRYLPAFPNLTYHRMDVYSNEFQAAISYTCSSSFGDLILVGIHLCGDLSRRALELRSLCGADAIFLSPCCLMRQVAPRKHRPGSFGYDAPRKARQLKVVTPYELWCWLLWGYASSASSLSKGEERLDLSRDPLMKTDKNIWLTVIKR